MTSSNIQFELVTAKGHTVYTFDNAERAKKRLFDRRTELPGAEVWEVETVVKRRRIYKPRPARRVG